ncbi:MAG: sensor histidine kinase [Catenulispora sp.]|nr:sensor histidine kinase [Catenulispora sp.]
MLFAAVAVLAVGSALTRTRPLAALAVLLGGSVLSSMALSELSAVQFAAPCLVIGSIAASRPRRSSGTALLLALSVVLADTAATMWNGFPVDQYAELAVALSAVVAWTIGGSIRERDAHAEALRAQATAQAVTSERLRIARELHDMVAHSTGLVALQAGAASRCIQTQPLEARKALTAIELTSRETLAGLRRMLTALREADPDPARPGPAAGLADVERLAAATAEAGVEVDVRWAGRPRRLPPEIDLSAFRIIQEAVTNVVRHARVPACRVSVDYGAQEVAIEVVDDGRGIAGSPVAGYGLVGMRERVGLLHGEFTAGPRPEGGFRVAARLPVPAGA